MPNIVSSIQEYCKKINSRLSYFDMVSLAIVLIGVAILASYVHYKQSENYKEVVYQEGDRTVSDTKKDSSLPFGSKSGKTYTFSWCQGSTRIKEKNKIFFSSEEEAEKSGRTLSKLCKK